MYIYFQARNASAVDALEDVFAWFRKGLSVAIYDGTNSTRERRKFVHDYVDTKVRPSQSNSPDLLYLI